MKLYEIAEGSIINITVSKDDASINLTTTAVGYREGGLYVNPFMYEDALVAFDIPGLAIEMMVVREGEAPYYWKRVLVAKTYVDDTLYHVVISDLAGARLNRRNSFRVFVGEEGSAMQVPGAERIPILIKDISATGIGFIIKGEDVPSYKLGDKVHITYTDNEERFKIDVIAKVVRTGRNEAGYLYGCSFAKVYPQLNKYVAHKQVKNRKKKKAITIPLK